MAYRCPKIRLSLSSPAILILVSPSVPGLTQPKPVSETTKAASRAAAPNPNIHDRAGTGQFAPGTIHPNLRRNAQRDMPYGLLPVHEHIDQAVNLMNKGYTATEISSMIRLNGARAAGRKLAKRLAEKLAPNIDHTDSEPHAFGEFVATLDIVPFGFNIVTPNATDQMVGAAPKSFASRA